MSSKKLAVSQVLLNDLDILEEVSESNSPVKSKRITRCDRNPEDDEPIEIFTCLQQPLVEKQVEEQQKAVVESSCFTI